MPKFYIFYILFILLAINGRAQFYVSDEDQASLKWRYLKTPHFKIVYNDSLGKDAERLANTMEYLYLREPKTMHHSPKNIPILMHSQNLVSNGMVAWAPSRMELIVTPPQDNYGQDWLDQLAVHEFRHVIQIDKLNLGFTKAMSFFLGEESVGIVTALFTPRWFLEGDAVCTETALTNYGRGRLPVFEMALRTQRLANYKFSLTKAYFGSFKDFVPDFYQFGYQLTAFARVRFGDSVWSNTINRVGKAPFTITPFNSGIKSQTKFTKYTLYDKMYENLDSVWKKQEEALTYSNYKSLTKPPQYFTNYHYVSIINDSTYLAQKSGIDQINQFVIIHNSGQEEIVYTPGFSLFDNLSVSNNRVVWSEIIPNLRWPNKNSSAIKLLDLKSKKTKNIISHSRYFSPALSPNADLIAVIETDLSNHNSLNVLEISTGKVISKSPSNNNDQLLTPFWDVLGGIYCIEITKKGKSIVKLDTLNHRWQTVLPASIHEITHPCINGSRIIFEADYSGINNIYAYDTLSKSIYQLTSANYGAFEPAVSNNGKTLAYSNYTPKGYGLALATMDSLQWKPIEAVKNNSLKRYEQLATQEGFLFNSDSVPTNHYLEKRYHKALNLFRVHSWSPYSVTNTSLNTLNLENLPVTTGLALYSQNLLSTAITTVGYSISPNANNYFYTQFTYKGWYPIINFSYLNAGDITKRVVDPSIQIIKNPVFNTLIYIPFNLTTNRYVQSLNPYFSSTINDVYTIHNDAYTYSRQQVSTIYGATYSRYLKLGERDINPKFGQVLSANYTTYPSSSYSNWVKGIGTKFFLPGLINHQSIKIYAGYEECENFISSQINPSVGYENDYIFNNYVHKSLLRIIGSYTFPLFYPDWDLWKLAYFKRVRANLFYDYSYVDYYSTTKSYYSTGIDILTDVHVLQLAVPFNIGVRFAYLPQTNALLTYPLITVNLF